MTSELGTLLSVFFLLLVIVLSFLLMAPIWETFIFAFVGDIFIFFVVSFDTELGKSSENWET